MHTWEKKKKEKKSCLPWPGLEGEGAIVVGTTSRSLDNEDELVECESSIAWLLYLVQKKKAQEDEQLAVPAVKEEEAATDAAAAAAARMKLLYAR